MLGYMGHALGKAEQGASTAGCRLLLCAAARVGTLDALAGLLLLHDCQHLC